MKKMRQSSNATPATQNRNHVLNIMLDYGPTFVAESGAYSLSLVAWYHFASKTAKTELNIALTAAPKLAIMNSSPADDLKLTLKYYPPMKFMKPPIKMEQKEKQWDNRFYLAKLNDYEVKRQFVIKKQSKRPPSQIKRITDEEQLLQQRKYELQAHWEKFKIPHFHRLEYLKYVKDIETIQHEILDLNIGTSVVQQMMKITKGREKCLQFLISEQFEDTKFSELIYHLRVLTLNVCETYMKWRDQLHPSAKWKYGKQNLDYLEKLQVDTTFLKQHYADYNAKDPFFMWMIKLAHQNSKLEHMVYHKINREQLRRIREAEVMLLQHSFIDKQLNLLTGQEADIIDKYITDMNAPQAMETLPQSPKYVNNGVNIQEILVSSQDQLTRVLQSIPNDFDISQLFPDDPNLFDKLKYKECKILEFYLNQQLHGIVICNATMVQSYKTWRIDQIKLGSISEFQQLIELILPMLLGNEIIIQMSNYLQNDQLTDCKDINQILSMLEFQYIQSNDTTTTTTTTIYCKKSEYTFDKHHLSFNQYIYQQKLQNEQICKCIIQKQHTQNELITQLQDYLRQNIIDIDQIPDLKYPMELVMQDDQLVLMDLMLRFPKYNPVVIDEYMYFHIIQEQEYTNIYSQTINGILIYQLATYDQKQTILISESDIDIISVDFNAFQPLDGDISIPMFKTQQITSADFNSINEIEFSELIFYPQSTQLTKYISRQFTIAISINKEIVCKFRIGQQDCLKYNQQYYQHTVEPYEQRHNPIEYVFPFKQSTLNTQPIQVQIMTGCYGVCSIDNGNQFRRWHINSVICPENQVQDVLQQLVNFILLLDQTVLEISIDFHHRKNGEQFVVNKSIQQSIIAVGFKWKLQINDSIQGIRYTNYVFKNPNQPKSKDHINVKMYYSQSNVAAIDVSPLNNSFHKLLKQQGQLQPIWVPFSNLYQSQFPIKVDTKLLMQTSIQQCFNNYIPTTVNGQNYIVIQNQQVSIRQNPQLNQVYFIQMPDIIICISTNRICNEIYQQSQNNGVDPTKCSHSKQIGECESAKAISQYIIQNMSNDNENDIATNDLMLPCFNIEFNGNNYKGQLHMETSTSSSIAINVLNYTTITKPFFIGIIQQQWLDNNKEMILQAIVR